MKHCTRLATVGAVNISSFVSRRRKTKCQQALIISIILFTTPLWADESRYWQCTTSDGNNKQWVIKNIYERAANAKAFDACKKHSPVPHSCTSYCEEFYQGVSTTPLWQCTALDQNAKPWISHTFAHLDDAAIAAKANCEEHTSVPGSCYLNTLTCKNLHQWP